MRTINCPDGVLLNCTTKRLKAKPVKVAVVAINNVVQISSAKKIADIQKPEHSKPV